MEINFIEYFERTVARYPAKTAVADGERRITFSALKEQAVSLASRLAAIDGAFKRPIAVLLDKSIESVYADLAVVFSGNFFMNLDVAYPAERIKNVLDLVRPAAIISQTNYFKKIAHVVPPRVRVILLDEAAAAEASPAEEALRRQRAKLIDTDPFCIINTSGSTGTPKGVVLNHRSFFDFTAWAVDTFRFGDDLIMGSLSPIVFDIYVFELCMLMAKASTLVVLPGNMAAFPARLLERVERERVNFLFWVPTIMVNIANMDLLSTFKLKDIQTVWFAGEVFPTKQYNYWHRHLPRAVFANLYGPIEITLDCTYYIPTEEIADSEPLPIGWPCRNTDILVLDEADKPVEAPGAEGELCVRGTSLAMGYYNNPEKTRAAFVQNPLNSAYPETIYRTGDIVSYNSRGELMFKGRKDNIVKHLGYRTDLGEIEHVIINTLKLVNNGCVVYNTAKKEITLFYEAGSDIPERQFRLAIAKVLPKYMIPTAYHREALLKRNTNGKIDRLYYKELVNG